MTRPLDTSDLKQELARYLRRVGPTTSRDARDRLGISQPSFSRLVRTMAEVLIAGRARRARYALRRPIEGLPDAIPVYEIGGPDQPPRHLLTLHPIEPSGFHVQGIAVDYDAFHDDLPWFLHDLRPAGFLGRQVPRRHPDLQAPVDIRLWNDTHVLRWLSRYGWDTVGSLVVGESAYRRHLEQLLEPGPGVLAAARHQTYPTLAEDALRSGHPGSSAAGEHPKFLTTVDHDKRQTPVLVKFSPPIADAPSRRTADLLIAEHLALQTLSSHGIPAAASTIIEGGNQVFLELERFDRPSLRHRQGVVSLLPLDMEFVGSDLSSWRASVAALADQGVVPTASLERVRWLECFGQLIANSDMHPGNLSFLIRGLEVVELAPVYDMLPMAYAAWHGQVRSVAFAPPLPDPSDADVWPGARQAAHELWLAVAADGRISRELVAIAHENAQRLDELSRVADLLPR